MPKHSDLNIEFFVVVVRATRKNVTYLKHSTHAFLIHIRNDIVYYFGKMFILLPLNV